MSTTSAKRILVVDDSRIFRHLVSMHLEAAGYRIIAAENGAEAIKRAISEQPDLIVLDIQMPVMDGAQALAALKAREDTRDIPVLIITTLGRKEDERLLRQGGASGFLSKPIRERQVLKQVQMLIGLAC